MFGTFATSVIGTKSFTGSKGRLEYMLMFTPIGPMVLKSSV
jgi:hypothetical protein